MNFTPPVSNSVQNMAEMAPGLSQDSWNQGMVHNILQANPGLRRVYSEDNFQTHMPTEQRLQDPIHQGRFSEFYPKGEPGGGDMLPNPWSLNNYNLEYYHPDALGNGFIRQALTKGEMLHGMVDDPSWQDLKTQFSNQFSPAVQEHYKYMPKDQFERQITDAFLRGSFFQNPTDETGLHPEPYASPGDYWNNGEWLKHYSPYQQETIQKMLDLIQNPASDYLTPRPTSQQGVY